MILSSESILKALSTNQITIEPFDSAALETGAYMFTLDEEIRLPIWPNAVDSRTPQIEFTTTELSPKGFPLEPGGFILGRTREQVALSGSIGCLLDTRTSHARIGLNALQASTYIEPGQYLVHQTLEITNVGKSTVVLYPGIKIVKGIFFSVEK